MAKIIKTGGNSQKLVFTMLWAILLLEFGSLTKLQKIWGLAFGSQQGSTTNTSTTNTSAVQVTPTTHPSNPVVSV